MDGTEDVCIDPLFVGLTRPATVMGIPYTAFILECLGTAITFLAVGNPLYLGLAVPFHSVLYLVSAQDPGAFDAILMWMKTTGRCRNARFWGAASFSPLSTRKWIE